MKKLLTTLALVVLLVTPRAAHAFCGFYVSGADAKLFADATQVVLMREGTRTVLSMQNDYQGPAADFAMVVPVPVVLQKENVKTLPKEIFAKVDALSAPRLVEYWESDPCPPPSSPLTAFGNMKPAGKGAGLSGIGGAGAASEHSVKIEAQFEVGEYEILILSAKDSGGLDAWLRENGYKIPENAEPALRPYVQAGSKFFVAKVNIAKVKLEDGRAQLSPLRFHYDSDTFSLPVRLGMLNSSGTQDLIVQILAPQGQRYAVSNYPVVTIPTNLDVAESARKSFSTFYAALFDKTLEKTPGAVVTEYAWGANSCDPCPGSVQGLTMNDLATLGGDVMPSAKTGPLRSNTSDGPRGIVNVGNIKVSGGANESDAIRVAAGLRARFRACYQAGLNADPSMSGSVTIKAAVSPNGDVTSADLVSNTGVSPATASCIANVIKRASFSSGGSIVIPVTLASEGPKPTTPPVVPIGLLSVGDRFVLTRLHARYARGALANDLVFSAAGAITGGRENRNTKGDLEEGAVTSTENAFQARYAIRHPWPGEIKCEKPIRGVWGGPWPDAGAKDEGAAAATKLAYAPRGGVTLASFLPNGAPELAVPAPEKTVSEVGAGKRASRCGCDVIGGERSDLPALLGLSAMAVLALRGRRRRVV